MFELVAAKNNQSVRELKLNDETIPLQHQFAVPWVMPNFDILT